ncbi:DUF6887 family protein [Microcystis aeruginosa]|uniref:DUF6887 family protein n=1 Tax=Microcystis aeruginosa TaxID=1126 RepID=UPI00232AE98C|nr:hypothetical protein [Microcystis aeruginosa]MDB9414577.1 hypothetical protein [Microcystis aeruginosa CS-567/02]
MNHQPDFYQMSRPELRKYVLSHREDDEVLRIYMNRMRTEPGVTRFTLTPSQEDMKKLEEFLRAKIDK